MKLKYAAYIESASGKMGNVVASTGKGGAYQRARVIPFNPKSTAQTTARANMTTVSQDWKGLTEGQRVAWNSAAPNWISTGIFGNKLEPSGFNLYVKLNLNLLTIGVAQIVSPPTKSAVASLSTFSAAQVHAGATTLTFTATPAPAGSSVIVEATAPQSAGRYSIKSQYRVIAVLAAGQASPYTATTVYNAKFGTPGAAGQKVFFRIKSVSSTTGQIGASLTAVATVS